MPEVIEALCDRHVVAIAAGHTHSMVLTDKGKVLSFGSSLGVLCMSRLFREIRTKIGTMADFAQRVELACKIDEAKLDLVLHAKGRIIYLTEQQWQGLSPSAFEFLCKHNENMEYFSCRFCHLVSMRRLR